MFRYLPFTALILWATSSNAAIQNSDFWFHDEGDSVFIDGTRGGPLHIDYIGAPLTKPLTVRVTPNNPKLKIAAPTCTFTKKNNDCRLIVQLKNQRQKVYGINHFTVTEAGGSRGVLNARAASDTSTVGFGVGVQGKDMPAPIIVVVNTRYQYDTIGRAVAINATQERRNYAVVIDCYKCDENDRMVLDNGGSLPAFSLPPQGLCYPDIGLFPAQIINPYAYKISLNNVVSSKSTGTIQDITNPSDPIYNGFYHDNDKNNISSCSAQGNEHCASNKWGSMIVGLANPGSTDMEGGVRAGQIEILRDNSWKNYDAYIYYSGYWNSDGLALLQIQGSTDGSENWDVKVATPSILEIQSAPPCSNYLEGDPSVTFNVRLKIYGPGSVSMPGNPQCQAFNLPNESFTYCTGSGSRNEWYEITAVPEAGKTFAGWGSDGLCDDTKTTCRFRLTREVGMRPGFY